MSDEKEPYSDIEEFVVGQVKLFTEVTKKMHENAREYHRKNCPNPEEKLCEKKFMEIFQMLVAAELAEPRKPQLRVIRLSDFLG